MQQEARSNRRAYLASEANQMVLIKEKEQLEAKLCDVKRDPTPCSDLAHVLLQSSYKSLRDRYKSSRQTVADERDVLHVRKVNLEKENEILCAQLAVSEREKDILTKEFARYLNEGTCSALVVCVDGGPDVFLWSVH